MKLKATGGESRRPIKAAELVRPQETEDRLVFDIYDFFTPEEWAKVVPFMHAKTVLLPRLKDPEVVDYLQGCLALSIVDPEKFESLQSKQDVKEKIRAFFEAQHQLSLEADLSMLTPLAVWVWPDLKQDEYVAARLAECEREIQTQTGVCWQLRGEVALLQPEVRNQLNLEGWLEAEAPTLSGQNSWYDWHTTQRELLALAVFFPGRQDILPNTVRQIKKKLQLWMTENRTSQVEFIKYLEQYLMEMALIKALMAESIEVKESGITIQDRKEKVGQTVPLPERPLA